ncbi:hypothetical protein V8B97DRAFT_1993288 [Scleroderma yunnanense]
MVLPVETGVALFLWASTSKCRIPPLSVSHCVFVVQTELQVYSRVAYAFSRDHGLPDSGYFRHMLKWTQMPLRAIWLATVVSMLLGLLDLASPIEANAIFAIPVMVLDLSYMIPIYLCEYSLSTPWSFFLVSIPDVAYM